MGMIAVTCINGVCHSSSEIPVHAMQAQVIDPWVVSASAMLMLYLVLELVILGLTSCDEGKTTCITWELIKIALRFLVKCIEVPVKMLCNLCNVLEKKQNKFRIWNGERKMSFYKKNPEIEDVEAWQAKKPLKLEQCGCVIHVNPGDWVGRDGLGDLRVFSDEVFRKAYSPADGSSFPALPEKKTGQRALPAADE